MDRTRAKEIFLAAAELGAAARGAYLDTTCGTDAGLRARVEALLRAHDEAGSFLGTPAAAMPEPDPTATRAVHSDPDADPVHTRGATGAPDPEDDALAFLAPPTRPDALGRLGHYDVLEVLGRGGFGIVFRAFDDVLQRVVAVKVMAPSIATASPARKRFLREARSSAAVRHENVVQVYEVVERPLPYLVMEFIPGQNLQQRIDRTGPLDIPEVVRIGRQIAEGLTAAHATDLIHRDIKPSNVLIEAGPNHRAKITDFGLARAADDASISQSGLIAGTPMYMAPEQALGHKLDQRADLFSLGSVLYQMASGRPPFRANSTLAVLKRVAEDTPRPIREIISDVPDWFCRIVEKLHAKKPADRYQSAREVADVLADCETQLKGSAGLTDFTRIPKRTPLPRRFRPGRRRLALAAIACAALILTVLAYPDSYRYVTDTGRVDFAPEPGLVSVIALRGDDAVTDWYSPEKKPSIELPAGRYTFNASFDRRDRTVHWEITTRGLFSSSTRTSFLESPEIEVGRGQRITVRAVFRDKPGKPPIPEPPGEWTALYNGKNLAGWKMHSDRVGGWSVEDGLLVGRSSTGHYLFSERDDYRDFHLRAEVKVSREGDGGLFFRSPFSLTDRGGRFEPEGYEAEIFPETGKPLSAITKGYTGSLSGLVMKQESPVQPEEWFVLEVIASGSRAVIKVNGEITADFDTAVSSQQYRRGHFVLQAIAEPGAKRPTVVRFRKIEIKAPTDPRASEFAAGEQRTKLAGIWVPGAVHLDAKPLAADQSAGLEIRFGDGTFELRRRDDGGERRRGKFQIDADKKQLVLLFDGNAQPVRCTYRLDAGRLSLNFGGWFDPDAGDAAAFYPDDASTGQNNLRAIGLAIHNFGETHGGKFPAAITRAKDRTPLLSWRVAVLPQLGHEALYRQFKLDEAWDSPHNKALIEKMPTEFAFPGVKAKAPGLTHYRAFVGPGTAFDPRPEGVRFADFAGQLAKTILVAEAADPMVWTGPDDLPFAPDTPLPKLGVDRSAAHVLLGDGSVAPLPTLPEKAMRSAISRTGRDEQAPNPFSALPWRGPPMNLVLEPHPSEK